MTNEETFIVRWIEWNELDYNTIEYIQHRIWAGQGTEHFRAIFGGIFAAVVTDRDAGMPSVDDLAKRYNVEPVDAITEDELKAAGPEKFFRCLQYLEGLQPDPDLVQTRGEAKPLFSPMNLVAKDESAYLDFVKYALLQLHLPEDALVEEVRFLNGTAKVKTFTVKDTTKMYMDNFARRKGVEPAQTSFKFYKLAPDSPPIEIKDWDSR